MTQPSKAKQNIDKTRINHATKNTTKNAQPGCTNCFVNCVQCPMKR